MAVAKEFSLLLFVVLYIFHKTDSALSIRGVSLTKLPLYDSSKDFTCLDGSLTIPFSSINDDYCDCQDGSDEPGTAACPNGFFHCTNAGFKPRNIPSSRVNDGICDCCDGSDEYEGLGSCSNNCKELYKLEFEKKRQDIEIAKQGLTKKQEYTDQGKQKKEERKQKLNELKAQLEEKSKQVDDLRAVKEDAEADEKELKDKHEKEWEEKKSVILAERDKKAAEAAFEVLDTDHTGSITVAEVVQSKHFDKQYTDEEAKELLGGSDEVDMPKFTEELWKTIKEKYKENPGEQSTGESSEEVPPTEAPTEPPPPIPPSIDDHIEDNPDVPEVDGDDDEDEDDEEEKTDATPPPPPPKDDDALDSELKMPDYDEETKAKMDVADKARKDFDNADSEKRKIEQEINDIDKMMEIDFGEHEEFAALSGECFEFKDREYTYKLCPFEKATQQPKDGGSETSLGTWGEWTGDEQNKYSRMKYKGGQNCWNGPDRSTEVVMSCGSENQLISVSEPSRCEYRMEFKSPAVCHEKHTMIHDHQEL